MHHRIDETLVGDGDDALRSHANGDVVVHSLCKFLLHGLNVLLVKIRANQANTAVDIVSDTTYAIKQST